VNGIFPNVSQNFRISVFWIVPIVAQVVATQAGFGQEVDRRPSHRIELPAAAPVKMERVAKLGPGPGKENSGIVRSRTIPDLFWIHNDSGDEPRVYPVRADGSDYQSERYAADAGVIIGGAINVDWEDITMDADGHLIVADVGNNRNDRRDLVLYYLPEPSPLAGRTTWNRKVFVHYPEQTAFPAPKDDFNYDCEAVFTVGNTVHLLTKHRSDRNTRLYRRPEISNALTYVDTFDLQGQAVAADCSVDGKRLVVITYSTIWLFERDNLETPFFQGTISWAPFESQQVEAVCFVDDQTLFLADEDLGELFRVSLDQLVRISPTRGD
jgi:hypothetical protein